MTYTDKAAVLTFAQAMLDSPALEAWLDETAAVVGGATFYRPYAAIAFVLAANPERVVKLSGAQGSLTFADITTALKWLLAMQRAKDAELGITGIYPPEDMKTVGMTVSVPTSMSW